MRGQVDHYTIDVDVVDGPGIQALVDIVADGLEQRGYSPHGGYEVLVTGPPELKIRMVPR